MTDPTADDGVEFPALSAEELSNLNHIVFHGPKEVSARRQAAARASYEAMTPTARKQVLLAEYRCRTKKRCLLLHVWQTPQGRCYYHPRYDLSPEVNQATSVEAARKKRTSDGGGKWLPRWGSFDDLLDFCGEDPDLGTNLNCDHVRDFITGKRLAAEVNGVTPGSPAKVLLPDDTPGDVGGTFS